MYDIKKIDDSELYTLLELNKEMREIISPEANNYSITAQLLQELTYKDALALGLYKDNSLVGFVSGYSASSTTYWFSGIYIRKEHRLKVLDLLREAENILPSNYVSWESAASSEKGRKMLEKFGAVQARIIYKKDL